MEPRALFPSLPWYATQRFHRVAVAILVAVFVVEGAIAVFLRLNDFVCHRHFGEAFLAGDPYGLGNQHHYLLGRAMCNALTARLHPFVERGLYYLAASAGLFCTLRWWSEMTWRRTPLPVGGVFATSFFALAIIGPYLIRDLDECGLQLLLLFFLTASAHALSQGRSFSSGFWLATAITWKVTPMMFLPFLAWKREWRALGWTVACIVLWNLAPACYLGWDRTIACHEHWFRFTAACLTQSDPSENGVEVPRHLNQSLSLAIARYLQTYPTGHPLALDHPGFYQPGHLDARTAAWVVKGALLVLAVLLAWRMRKPWTAPEFVSDLAPEWAAVTVLCTLLSPLCWLQHLVVVLPCVLLSLHAQMARVPGWRWQRVLLGVAAVIFLVVHKDIIGRDFCNLLMSYKLHTLASFLVVCLVLTVGKESSAAPAIVRENAAPVLEPIARPLAA